MMNYPEIEGNLGYVFKDKRLLKTALTLASADKDDNNQIMEFFGDAILEFLVSERIFSKGKNEGELTELRKMYVSDSALTPVSEKLQLEKFFIKSSGDTNLKKCIPSAYEAVLAAIYLDGGMEAARSFVYRTIDFNAVATQKNYKGELQEYLQSFGEEPPEYRCKDRGTAQSPEFEAEITVRGKVYSGVAKNKKQAEQSAACAALSALKKL